MKNNSFNRIALSFCALAMTLCANAQFAGGSGTFEDPYQISTPEQLDAIRGNNGTVGHYKLMNDIDLTEWLAANSPTEGWKPIGESDSDYFCGTIDGDGHVISGFYINRPEQDRVGFIGCIKDVGNPNPLEDANYYAIRKLGIIVAEGKSVSGFNQVGTFIGGTAYSSNIIKYSECFAITDVSAVGKDNKNGAAGGIMGYSSNNGGVLFENCYTAGKIYGRAKSGGLLGQSYRRASAEMCYSTCEITAGEDVNESKAGGLFGELGFPNGNGIRHDLKTSVAANPSIKAPIANRLVGYVKPENATPFAPEMNYAWEGLTVNDALITDGAETNVNGLNKTGAEITDPETYLGEDNLYWYDDVWTMGNETYQLPILLAFSADNQPKIALSYLPTSETGIRVGSADDKVSVFPVYASDKITILNKEVGSEVSIINAAGVLVLSTKDAEVNLSSLSTGLYFVNVQGQVVKIVKQ